MSACSRHSPRTGSSAGPTRTETPLAAEIVVITGSRRGQALRLTPAGLTIGRNSDVDLRFDPLADLEVSGRHALIVQNGRGAWVVRDLGSTNGTYLNGARIATEAVLRSADRISFGAQGPQIEFKAIAGEVPRAGSAQHRRVLAVGVAVVTIAIIGLVLLTSLARTATLQSERSRLLQQIDSLTVLGQQTIASLQTEIVALTEALEDARAEVGAVTTQLEQAQADGNAGEIAALRQRLAEATSALDQREEMARLDFAAIQRANRRAVAVIYVENADGSVVTGTAFAVSPDAILITSRHVLLGPEGTARPGRIAIQFSDSDQVWPARMLASSNTVDLAAVKVDNIVGDVPTVHAFNLRPDTIQPGDVVASIGFPAGRGSSSGSGIEVTGVVQPLLSAGVITSISDDTIEVQGYGNPGASGSPVFDSAGSVVAVIFGGVRDSDHPLLLAVPSPAVADLLAHLSQ